MLLIHARAGLSDIHGIGLIAQEFVAHGTRVWELRAGFDLLLSQTELLQLSPPAQDQVIWYAYWDSVRGAYVLSGDDDRFTNHADDPNTASDSDATYAVRDIYPGQEITWDYRAWGGVEFVDRKQVGPPRRGPSPVGLAALDPPYTLPRSRHDLP
jgi:hypothetical protein